MFYILWLLWPCMDLWSENKQIQIQIPVITISTKSTIDLIIYNPLLPVYT